MERTICAGHEYQEVAIRGIFKAGYHILSFVAYWFMSLLNMNWTELNTKYVHFLPSCPKLLTHYIISSKSRILQSETGPEVEEVPRCVCVCVLWATNTHKYTHTHTHTHTHTPPVGTSSTPGPVLNDKILDYGPWSSNNRKQTDKHTDANMSFFSKKG